MVNTPERLKGLSIRQPWAEMIFQGLKTIEYRSQPTKIRGRVYIYASLGKPDFSPDEWSEIESEIGTSIENLPAGVVVGTVEITDCTGSNGDFEWHLANPERLDTPIRPIEQTQPVWFHPFGRPTEQTQPKPGNPSKSKAPVRSPSDELRFKRSTLPAAQLPTTPYHAKYLAYELTKRCSSDNLDKLTAVLSDAQVDLNPHQVEAALFAFSNPLSKGAILADEVGLGKTIEAGLLLAQMWAERKKRLLVIAPANLRKRVFGLTESNFLSWNAAVTHDEGEVQKQLELHTDHIRDDRTSEDILYELLIKSGFPLTTPVELVSIAGKRVYSVAEGAVIICLEKELTLELIRAIAQLQPERVVFLDEGFAGNDQLKTNAVQTFKTKGVVSFRTV